MKLFLLAAGFAALGISACSDLTHAHSTYLKPEEDRSWHFSWVISGRLNHA